MIYIRADANSQIGMGHIMRCLSIADAAKTMGQKVVFILADEKVKQFVEERGYEPIILYSDYGDMETELSRWPRVTQDVILVDSYYVTADYLRGLKELTGAGKLVYIDDLASFPYPVDVLINYNAYADFSVYEDLYEGKGIPDCVLGPGYAPLRSMFRNLPQKVQKEKVENVMIFTGGADLEHIALSIVKSGLTNYTCHLLIGALNTDMAEIEKLASKQKSIILHKDVTDMRSLISSMDIVVSAAGSTLYEVCSCGVPLATYIVADNQILGAKAFENLSLAINMGDFRKEDNPAERIVDAIAKLSEDYRKRVEIGIRMQTMIDGAGAERIVRRILELT